MGAKMGSFGILLMALTPAVPRLAARVTFGFKK
jgi:hypothetical protein